MMIRRVSEEKGRFCL